MATLLVDYGKIENIKSDIDDANTYFENRKSHIISKRSELCGVSSSRNYLSQAVKELYSKENRITQEQSKLNGLKNQLNNFAIEADEADQRVAKKISGSTESFCYRNGIGTEGTNPIWDFFPERGKVFVI